jgi:hypothetical protein
MIMSSPGPQHQRDVPAGMLPAPGPYPPAQQPGSTVMIFFVVVGIVVWLLAKGYPASMVLSVLAGSGALASAIAAQLVGVPPGSE